MTPSMFFESLAQLVGSFATQPVASLRLLRRIPVILRGSQAANRWPVAQISKPITQPAADNPLAAYFKAHTHGKGIYKWLHYFDAYHRHFQKFVGREVHVLEIGIYSGGSLEMWRHYFGPQLRLYGVDIQEACKKHENEYTKVFVGDQADRRFWSEFKRQVPPVDILIDDGGHSPEQQMVTLEQMLPHVRPGGVYFCEDIHGRFNEFASFVFGLCDDLNARLDAMSDDPSYRGEPIYPPTGFQSHIHSLHCYPFATVIEKREPPIDPFRASKQGTEWGKLI